MTIDKQKLKALAEAATQSHGARRVEVDPNGVHVIGDGSWNILSAWHTPDGKGSQNAEFAAAASPATVLALLAEIERLTEERDSQQRVCIHVMEQRDQLKAENEAMRNSLGYCAASLEGEMLQKFGGQKPEDMHPVTRREYDRDMAELAGYRAAMAKEAE